MTALPLLRAARAEGLQLTAETCPHFLHFTAEANREALWAALAEGVIDFIASDHPPCTPGLETIDACEVMSAWGGVAGLQLAQPIVRIS